MIVPGVVGSTENNAVSYVTSMAFIPWPTPPEGNYLAVNSCSRPVAGSFWISFVDACGMLATVDGDTVSVVVTDTEASPQPRVVVTTFGLDGQPIEERGITTLIETLAFTTGRVARVRFLDNGGDGHLLDTFTFGPITSQCYANCECDGVLDIFDFLCFGNKFAANDPYACDCDTSTGQGACDIFDFLCFGNAFDAGCP